MTPAEIVATLTPAQRIMTLTGDDRDASLEEYREMFDNGIMSRNGRYELSAFGREVRAYLASEQQGNDDARRI